ncbi:MAG: hypothetical protein ACJAS3_001060 [Roseivirga sp.]
MEKHKGDEFLVFTFLIIANAKAVESAAEGYVLLKVIAKLTLKFSVLSTFSGYKYHEITDIECGAFVRFCPNLFSGDD